MTELPGNYDIPLQSSKLGLGIGFHHINAVSSPRTFPLARGRQSRDPAEQHELLSAANLGATTTTDTA